MNRIRKPLLVCVLTILSLLSAGCYGTELEQRSSTAVITPSPDTKQSPAKSFGIIYPMTYPTYETMTLDATETARQHNIALSINAPDEANTEQQIRIMETMIKQGVDGIAISPVDAAALTPVINKAQAAGIPVVTFESDAPDSRRTAYVGADNYETGRQFAVTISNLLGNKGMILVETGMEEMLGLHQRLEGFLDYLTSQSAIEVLEVHYNEGSEDRAVNDMETMINAHPHFNAMVGLDFVSASASTLIWKAKGLNRISLSMGVTPASSEALLNGQLTAVISQNEGEWGRTIIETLLRASEGRQPAEFIDTGIKEIRQADVE